MRTKLAIAGAFALGAVVALPIGRHYGGSGRLVQVEVSPDKQERLELYRPDLWQQRLGYDNGDYAVARLSNAADGTTTATSDPFVYDGAGSTLWSRQTVDVGTAARFERATGRWSVE